MGPSDYFPSMSAADYVAMMSNPSTLGHPLVGTQHFLSFPTFTRTSPDTITGLYQVRAHHVRFSSDAQGGSDGKGDVKGYAKGWGRKVLAVATGHSVIQHFYTRTEEGWKLSGLRPEVGFDQGDLKGLFAVREEGEVVKTA
jgi:scytalone dehydratase